MCMYAYIYIHVYIYIWWMFCCLVWLPEDNARLSVLHSWFQVVMSMVDLIAVDMSTKIWSCSWIVFFGGCLFVFWSCNCFCTHGHSLKIIKCMYRCIISFELLMLFWELIFGVFWLVCHVISLLTFAFNPTCFLWNPHSFSLNGMGEV